MAAVAAAHNSSRLSTWLGAKQQQPMAPQVLVSLAEDVLSLFVDSAHWLNSSFCATLHLQIECPSAVQFRPETKYQPVKAWPCTDPVAKDSPHCPKHWFGGFICYALDDKPVAFAHSPEQLAAILHLKEVRLCATGTKVPLTLPQPPANSAPLAAAHQGQHQLGASSHQQQAQQPHQQQQLALPPKPVLDLDVSKPAAKTGCMSAMIMLDVTGASELVLRRTHKVLYCWCCAKDSNGKAFCKHHTCSRFNLLDRNGNVLGSVNSLPLLASHLGYSSVNLQSDQPDLLAILEDSSDMPVAAISSMGTAGAALAAAAGPGKGRGRSSSRPRGGQAAKAAPMDADSPPLPPQQQQQQEVGQKRSSAEAELPNYTAAKATANTRSRSGTAATAAAGKEGESGAHTAVLRLKLSAEDAGEQRQVLQQRLEAARNGPREQQQQQELEGLLQQVDQLEGVGFDVPLPVAQGSSNSARTRCLGVTLQVNVADMKELSGSSTFVRVVQGRRCGHEGGLKRACKRHKVARFVLETADGSPLASVSHLEGLANRLKVSRASVLELPGLAPLTDYTGLPATPTWHRAADSSLLRVWLPHEERMLPGNWQQRPCCGLDVYVDTPKDVHQAVGSPMTIMSVVHCGNEAGPRATCRRHTAQGPLQLFSWDDSLAGVTTLNTTPGGAAIHACADLAQLAMWLGVGKVHVLEANSNVPLQYYTQLAVPAAIQMSLAGLQQQAALAPPSLEALQQASAAAAAAAAAGVAAVKLDGTSSAQAATAAAAAASGAAADPVGAGVVVAGGLASMLAAAAESGSVAPLNILGNSRVEVCVQGDSRQPQEQQQEEGQEQQQQQRQMMIRVDGHPVGGHQGHPCRLLHVVLLLPDKNSYQQGLHYPVLFAHRCGNEAGNRSRCRQHSDAAVRVLATDAMSVQAAAAAQSVPSYALSTAKSTLTHGVALSVILDAVTVGKVNNSRDLAALLGCDDIKLVDTGTDEVLGDVAVWSPTNNMGMAAKVAPSGREAAAAAALAAVAAAGVPGVPSAQALLAALTGRTGTLAAPLTKVEALELDPLRPAKAAAAAHAAAAAAPAAAPGGLGLVAPAADADVVMADAAADTASGGLCGGSSAAPSPPAALAASAAAAAPPSAALGQAAMQAHRSEQQQQQQQPQATAAGIVSEAQATVATPPAAASVSAPHAATAVMAGASSSSQLGTAASAAQGALREPSPIPATAAAGDGPSGSGSLPPSAAATTPAAPAPTAAARSGNAGFATSAPRHLQHWATSFK